MFRITYPDSDLKDETFDDKDRQSVIDLAINKAKKRTVEVYEVTDEEQDDLLLARYEK